MTFCPRAVAHLAALLMSNAIQCGRKLIRRPFDGFPTEPPISQGSDDNAGTSR